MKAKYILPVILFGLIGFASFTASKNSFGKCTGDDEYKSGLMKLDAYKLIKDYRIQLSSGSPANPPAEGYMISIKAGLKYRLLPMNNPDNKTKMIMSIYQNEKKTILLATTYNPANQKHYPFVDFSSKTTGTFVLFFEFEKAAKGCGVGLFGVAD
jgi:hypothetical protein